MEECSPKIILMFEDDRLFPFSYQKSLWIFFIKSFDHLWFIYFKEIAHRHPDLFFHNLHIPIKFIWNEIGPYSFYSILILGLVADVKEKI